MLGGQKKFAPEEDSVVAEHCTHAPGQYGLPDQAQRHGEMTRSKDSDVVVEYQESEA